MKNYLSDEVRQFIVQQLACFDTPSQVAKQVKEEFNIDIDRVHVNAYNPASRQGKTCAKKWKELFSVTRKKFLEDTAAIPIANQSFRLTQLGKLYDKVVEQGNTGMAASILEQASKETGGMYTNRQKHEHTSPDGTMTPAAPAPSIDGKLVSALVDKLID